MDTLLTQGKIAFIGGGNLAQALIGGLLERAHLSPDQLLVVEPAEAVQQKLLQAFHVRAEPTVSDKLKQASVVILAVKPQIMHEVCSQLRPYLEDALIVSVAAGIRAVDLARWLGTQRVVRTMPNTPALVGAGMTGLAALAPVSADDRALAQQLLQAVGDTLWVAQESQLDAVTAVSGSGPAYVFYAMEAMQTAARELGFSEEEARRLSTATFYGAAKLAASSTDSAKTLREKVTSPNGTTFAAITRMNQANVAQGIVHGIHAAATRSTELGEELGKQ
jgi:pyrroline-5-carboxylate reductase